MHLNRGKVNPLLISIGAGVIGVGILLVLLVQSIEITVEAPQTAAPPIPGSTPSDPPLSSLDSPAGSDPSSGGDSGVQPGGDPDGEAIAPDSGAPTASGTDLPLDTPASGMGTVLASVPARTGQLRISNQTMHPLRVALLPQRNAAIAPPTDLSSSPDDENSLSAYVEPVHWDFDPGEGHSRGLIVVLPDGELQVTSGDVVIAFAQDGSRYYWGPYVVGVTSFPAWDETDKEWQLVLR